MNNVGRPVRSTRRPERPCRCSAYSAAGDTVSFERIRSVAERLGEHASVETVYGDPISVGDRTVVSVASVGYGFGGGGGEDGGGMGGGVGATPVGVVELTADETRFVRFSNPRRVGIALGIGFVLGVLFGRR